MTFNNDGEALAILHKYNINEDRGIIHLHSNDTPTIYPQDLYDAIAYLCDEFDYCLCNA